MRKCRFPITTAEEMHGELKETLCKMPKTESSPAIWLDHQMTLDERGLISVLALAAKLGVLDQIPGGATAEQLSRCPDMPKHFMADPISPLHYAAIHGHLDQVTGGATWQQLASAKSLRSKVTALHCAASFQHLDQIRGGVTIQDLQATLDKKGLSALEEARQSDGFSQIQSIRPNIHGSLNDQTPTMAKEITTPPPGDMLLKIRHIATAAIYRLVYLKNPTMTNGGPRNAWLAYNQSNSISHCVPEQDVFGFKPSFEIIDDRYNPKDRTEWDKIVSMRLGWRATFVAQLPTSNTYTIPGQAPTLPKSLANALRVGDTFLHKNGYTCAIAAMSSARVHYIDQIAASGNINGCCSPSAFVQRWKWLLPVKLPAPRLEVLSDPNY